MKQRTPVGGTRTWAAVSFPRRAHLVIFAVWQLLACKQVLVVLVIDLQHAGLHAEAPALLAQVAAALKHLHTTAAG